MDWLPSLVVGLAAAFLFAPAAVLLLTVFVLVPLAHLAPAPRMLARTSFDCPVSRRHVSAVFETAPEAAGPRDVLACSLFGAGPVRCKKGCLALAATGWAPSPMVARFALVSGDTVIR